MNIPYSINLLYEELKEVHYNIARINCKSKKDYNFYQELMILEERQKLLKSQLLHKGWFFDFELIRLEKKNE